MGSQHRWQGLVTVATLVAVTVTGCTSGSQPHIQNPPTSTSASSASASTPSIDPAARPAVDAYLAYVAASDNAERAPQAFVDGKNPATDFTKYTFDPRRARYTAYITGLAQQQVAFRGTPPQPRVSVTSVDIAAKPYPTVVLSDCRTPAPTWAAYDLKTGKRVPFVKNKVPLPYRSTVRMIHYQGRWGVSDVNADSTKTCTA
jgi:hypothetical protein